MLRPKIKIILLILLAALLGFGGFLFARNEARQTAKIKGGPAGVAADQFANWQTYYGWKKGFEIRIPPAWSKDFDHDGADRRYADKFWRDQIGRVKFLGFADKTEPNLVILIKDSDLVLEDFAKAVGLENAEVVNVNGLSGMQARKDNIGSAVIQNGKRFFYLIFTGRSDKAGEDLSSWEKMLSTFVLAPEQ